MPAVSAVVAEKDPEFGAYEQQIRIDVVFDNGVRAAPLRQIA